MYVCIYFGGAVSCLSVSEQVSPHPVSVDQVQSMRLAVLASPGIGPLSPPFLLFLVGSGLFATRSPEEKERDGQKERETEEGEGQPRERCLGGCIHILDSFSRASSILTCNSSFHMPCMRT